MTDTAPDNPYFAARKEWNEHYGSYVRSVRIWVAGTVIFFGLFVLAAFIAFYQAGQSGPEVATAAAAVPAKAEPKTPLEAADPNVIRDMLGNWVVAFRSVTPDNLVEKENIDKIFALTTDEQGRKIQDYLSDNHPGERARTVMVKVDVKSVVQESPTRWRVSWNEIDHDRGGRVLKTTKYSAPAFVDVVPAEAGKPHNPIGLRISSFEWKN
ncbi:MAG: VirB8/TrbF family protein [Alphaproteobacteria bacterium]|nr:VirB8/TrbF family protein [Alphaproteobacteria bacterium]